MTEGQEKGKYIAAKMREMQEAFRAQLTPENDTYARVLAKTNNEEATAEILAEDKDFLEEYLRDEILEMAIAVFKTDVHGMYSAGWVPFAKDPEEYRRLEKEQTEKFYSDVNKELDEHYKRLGDYYNKKL